MREQIENVAERIIASESFGHSQTYANLLRYLVEQSNQGTPPKELMIAIDVFGKQDFDPSESTLIRVYVYNLRKKLEAYYQVDEPQSRYRLRIPKGGYAVVLEERKLPAAEEVAVAGEGMAAATQSTSGSGFWRTMSFGLLGLMIVLVSLALNFQWWEGKEENLFLGDMVQPERKTMVVLGDHFIAKETDSLTGKHRSVRYARINSTTDFEREYANLHRPGTELVPRGYTFLVSNAAKWIQSVTAAFGKEGDKLDIRLRTQLTTEELRTNNLIVVGMLKTLEPFYPFFTASPLSCEKYEQFTLRRDNAEAEHFAPTGTSSSYHTDYGLVARFPGPTGNPIQLCTGIWDSATSHAVDLLTKDRLREGLENRIKQEFGEIPPYYEVFFRVRGRELLELSSEIIYVRALKPEEVEWGGKING